MPYVTYYRDMGEHVDGIYETALDAFMAVNGDGFHSVAYVDYGEIKDLKRFGKED